MILLGSHRGETDQPVVPGVFILFLFRNGHYVSPFPVNGNFTGLPGLLKYDGGWLSHFICQFPQDPWMHLIRSHGLVHLQVP